MNFSIWQAFSLLMFPIQEYEYNESHTAEGRGVLDYLKYRSKDVGLCVRSFVLCAFLIYFSPDIPNFFKFI